MFKEHKFVMWGKNCSCGKECSILLNNFHPWVETDFIAKVKCEECGELVEVTQKDAAEFYSKRIFSYFSDAEGTVVDIGCGEGFLSKFLISKDDVRQVFAIDIDEGVKQSVEELDAERGVLNFICADAENIEGVLQGEKVDYLVSRDVFMFVEDTDRYFDGITSIVNKGIRQMGWFVSGSERVKNSLNPDQIVEELKKRGWTTSIEYLDWYKCGYFIRADKIV